jgi:UV DNA damage endonuclease
MGMDATCKVQIHAGGAYGDKDASIRRFAERYRGLEERITKRLVIENDERIFNVTDCLTVHGLTGVPLVLDTLHHELFNTGEGVARALAGTAATWDDEDGLPIVDFSDQDPDGRRGKHAESFHPGRLRALLRTTAALDFDLMLEVKDKERSAIEALRLARNDRRLMLS